MSELCMADTFSATGADERHAIYAELAKEGPVHRIALPNGTPAWLVTGYAEARALLADPHLVRAPMPSAALLERLRPDLAPALVGHILNANGENHARLRGLLRQAFTVRRIQRLAPRIQQIARTLLDSIDDSRPVDLIPAFAFPLPITVICELLGVPDLEREQFRSWTADILNANYVPEDVFITACSDAVSYLRVLLAAKRRSPGDDLLSELAAARDGAARLTEDELTSMAFLLVAAGHETTVNLITNAVRTVLTVPGTVGRLCAEPDLMASAIEEFVRFDGPLQIAFPVLANTAQRIGAVDVQPGEVIILALLAANRDPRHFARPGILDLAREPNTHLGFGHGIHHCIGAPLARLEVRIALTELLTRYPNLRLVRPDELVRQPSILLHAFTGLPVELG